MSLEGFAYANNLYAQLPKTSKRLLEDSPPLQNHASVVSNPGSQTIQTDLCVSCLYCCSQPSNKMPRCGVSGATPTRRCLKQIIQTSDRKTCVQTRMCVAENKVKTVTRNSGLRRTNTLLCFEHTPPHEIQSSVQQHVC